MARSCRGSTRSGDAGTAAARIAVAPDTNAVAAASIIDSAGGTDPIRHEFYDESIQMFSLFRGQVPGYLLPRVRSECYRVLSRAVRDVYDRRLGAGRAKGGKPYPGLSAALYMSGVRMGRLISRLEAPDLDDARVRLHLAGVRRMSGDLRRRYRLEYSSREWREREIMARAGTVLTDPNCGSVQKREAYRMYEAQIECESMQLARFVEKYPNASDQRILAEAAALRDLLAKGGTLVMIASLDTGFFSPYYFRGGKSDLVTEEIRRRFGIVCGRPRAVFLMAGGRRAGRMRATGGRSRRPGARRAPAGGGDRRRGATAGPGPA